MQLFFFFINVKAAPLTKYGGELYVPSLGGEEQALKLNLQNKKNKAAPTPPVSLKGLGGVFLTPGI